MKILVVDDEEHIRQGISRFILSKNFLDAQVQTARDGEEALRMIPEEYPDIVISDVVMPGMGGLKFARRVFEQHPAVKIIVISGYSDVQFMKEAFRFQAIDYIFKPIDLQEFENTLMKAAEAVKREWEEQKRLSNDLPILREKLVCDLIDSGLANEAFVERAAYCRLSMPRAGGYAVFVFGLNDIRNKDLEQGVEEGTGCLPKDVDAVCAMKGPGLLACLLIGAPMEASLFRKQAQAFGNAVREAVYIRCGRYPSAGVSASVSDPFCLPAAYQQAMQALFQEVFWGCNGLRFYVDAPQTEDNPLKISPDFERQLMEALCGTASAALGEVLSAEFERWECAWDTADAVGAMHPSVSPAQILDLKLDLLTLLAELMKSGPAADDERYNMKTLINELLPQESLRDIKQWLSRLLSSLSLSYAQNRKRRTQRIIRSAKDIVRENAKAGLNVQDIARQLGISPNYLSTVFKAETGENLIEYITRTRMDCAAHLLVENDYKIGDIAVMIGYGDHNYFAKLFRRQFGTSPSQYRLSHQTEKRSL